MLSKAQQATLAELSHLALVTLSEEPIVKGAGGTLYRLERDGSLVSTWSLAETAAAQRRRRLESGSTK